MAGETVVKVKVPDNVGPGDSLDVVLIDASSANERQSLERTEESKREHIARARLRIKASIIVWSVFEVIIMLLLILSMSLPNFATLKPSSACNAVNPITGLKQDYSLSVFGGLSSSKEKCEYKSTSTDFCIPWTDKSWESFEANSGAATSACQ